MRGIAEEDREWSRAKCCEYRIDFALFTANTLETSWLSETLTLEQKLDCLLEEAASRISGLMYFWPWRISDLGKPSNLSPYLGATTVNASETGLSSC